MNVSPWSTLRGLPEEVTFVKTWTVTQPSSFSTKHWSFSCWVLFRSFLVLGSLIFRVKRKRRVLGVLTGLFWFDQRKLEAVEHRAVDSGISGILPSRPAGWLPRQWPSQRGGRNRFKERKMLYSALPTRWSILAKEGAFGGSEVLDVPALGERQARTCKRHAHQALLRSLTVNKLPQACGLCQSLFWGKKVLYGWNKF